MNPQQIINVCQANFEAHKFDCSGFVKAVATALQVTTFTPDDDANDIVQKLPTAGDWVALTPGDGAAAKAQADAGALVIGGLKGADQINPDQHGHVVIVVSGPLDPTHHQYPTAYWGSLARHPGQAETINFAWRAGDRDKVAYFAKFMG
jgi:hypothetical protein